MNPIWNRLIQSTHKKSKLPILLFNEYTSTNNNPLKESNLYGQYFVSTDRLSKAYHALLCHSKKKSWKYIDPFMQIWYSEFEKVNQQIQVAEGVLDVQLTELSKKLTSIQSPLKNRNQRTLKRVHQFISNFLKEYSPHTIIQDASPISLNELAFQSKYENLASKIMQQQLEGDSDLKTCICLIYRFEQSLVLHHYYMYSQLQLLKGIHELALSGTDHSHVILARWRQKYSIHSTRLQHLQQRFQAHLSQSATTIAAADAAANTSRMKKDVTCAICLSILKDPTMLSSCGHTFCRPCIQRVYCTVCRPKWNSISCTCSEERRGSCPLCRTPFELKDCRCIDTDLTKRIAHYFTEEKLHVRMQRWSNKWTEKLCYQHDPHMSYTILLMARKSWII